MQRNKRRHSIGFGYIGFGNSHSVFNKKSKKAFSYLKDKLNKESQNHFQTNFSHKTLSIKEKNLIKNKIRKDEKHKVIKTLAATFILLIFVIVTLKILIDIYMSKL